jgi:hypothetical protein
MTNVTFLGIVYPDEKLNDDYEYPDIQCDVDVHKGLRDSLYSIFCIPTLQNLSLRKARAWHAFDPLPPNDDSRVGPSNLMSLSLPDTVPLSRDPKEILTWPKALRHIYHESTESEFNYFFQNNGSEQITSPKFFIKGLHSQRDTLEELIYNNGKDCCSDDESTFDIALKEFVSLRPLVVSRDSLVEDGVGEEAQPVHETLLPNLEEL